MEIEVPERIQKLIPYPPGKPAEELERELGITDIVKVASNENPMGASPKVVEAICKSLQKIHLYPDGNAFYLKEKLSKFLKISPRELIFGSGSSELIELIIRTFAMPGDEVLTSQASFIYYKLASIAHGVSFVEAPQINFRFDLDAMGKCINEHTRFVFIANPNNPTGTIIDKFELERFIQRLPKRVILIMDEAYFEYVDAQYYPDSMDYRQQVPNLITLRTFSKAYGLAGLRVGYAVARCEIINQINKVRPPFNVNSLAQTAAIAALEDQEHLKKCFAFNKEEREWLACEFESIGYRVILGQTNFLLVDLGKVDGVESFDILLRSGVIVRPIAGYGLPNHHRVTIGTRAENIRVIAAYKALSELTNAQRTDQLIQ